MVFSQLLLELRLRQASMRSTFTMILRQMTPSFNRFNHSTFEFAEDRLSKVDIREVQQTSAAYQIIKGPTLFLGKIWFVELGYPKIDKKKNRKY